MLSGNLVGRDAVSDVGAFGLLRMHTAQPDRPGPRVLPVTVAKRLSLLLTETDRYDHLVLKRRQW